MTTTTSFELTERQKELRKLLGGKALHCGAKGGSRSGKTFLFIFAIVKRAAKAPGSRHAVLRFRFNHVKASVVHDTFPKVMETCFPNIAYKLDKTDWFAELPNGSQIWFGGLDDKERTEKILGQEYATIFLNECSQIPWSSRNLAVTRLAQSIEASYKEGAGTLALKMYYDYNPPSKAHWTYQLFEEKRDPESKNPLKNVDNYATIQMNPEDNLENLPTEYIDSLKDLSPRLQKRFLYGEYADATENALWSSEVLDKWRSDDVGELQRIIIGVDPSGAGEDDGANDEIGIVVSGLSVNCNAYVLEDLTLLAPPSKWGNVVTTAFDRHMADLVVGETNYGGAMVEHVIKTARPGTPYKAVHAARGKHIRAEPISALFDQGKVRMAGVFPKLEDEMCAMSTSGFTGMGSPNRLDAMVWAVTELFPSLTRKPKAKRERKRRDVYRGEAGWMAA